MLQLVWFKRDLRVDDHEALACAAKHGDVLPLYIIEPALWRQPDSSGRQWAFTRETLESLRDTLAALGQPLVVRTGSATEVLTTVLKEHPVGAVWSHQETGNAWTFQRDLAVKALLRDRGVNWCEVRQHGVVRGAVDRAVGAANALTAVSSADSASAAGRRNWRNPRAPQRRSCNRCLPRSTTRGPYIRRTNPAQFSVVARQTLPPGDVQSGVCRRGVLPLKCAPRPRQSVDTGGCAGDAPSTGGAQAISTETGKDLATRARGFRRQVALALSFHTEIRERASYGDGKPASCHRWLA